MTATADGCEPQRSAADEQRLAAAFESALHSAAERVVPTYHAQRRWVTAIRAGIEQLLNLIDENPDVGKLLIVDSLCAGETVLARRAEVLEHLADAVHRGRQHARAPACLTRASAHAAVGGVLAILHAQLTSDSDAPLAPLAGQLTAIVILPYQGPVAATRQARRPSRERTLAAEQADVLADAGVRITNRTVRVLRALAAQDGPGAGLSNRQIADHAGIADHGQASKLLARLARRGLIENTRRGAHRTGKANAWKLTVKGARLEWATRRQR